MKTMTKLGLAVTAFMATTVFNNVMAQKFEFKATWVKGSSGYNYGKEVSQKDSSIYIIDFANNKFEGPQGELSIISDVEIQDYSAHPTPQYRCLRYLFSIGKNKTAMAEIIFSVRNDSEPDELYMTDGGSFSFKLSGKSTELKK